MKIILKEENKRKFAYDFDEIETEKISFDIGRQDVDYLEDNNIYLEDKDISIFIDDVEFILS